MSLNWTSERIMMGVEERKGIEKKSWWIAKKKRETEGEGGKKIERKIAGVRTYTHTHTSERGQGRRVKLIDGRHWHALHSPAYIFT